MRGGLLINKNFSLPKQKKYPMPDDTYDAYLEHHGILGQKWGVRRFQNPDGSLTPAGTKRYLTGDTTVYPNTIKAKQLTKKDKKFFYGRLNKTLNDQGLAYNNSQLQKYEKRRKEAEQILNSSKDYKKLKRKVDALQRRIDRHEEDIFNKNITDEDEFMKALTNTDLYRRHWEAKNDLADFALNTLSGKDWFDDTIIQLGNYSDMDAKILPIGKTATASILNDYL